MGLSKASPFSPFFNPTAGQAIIAILALWALINGALLAQQGIITTGEAAKYIHNANYFLANGHLRSSNFQYYSIIIFLLAFCIKWHLGLWPVIFLQWLVSLGATLYFFNTLLKIFHWERTALAATILLLLNLPYQSFNMAVQSESLFHSLSLLFSCYLLRHDVLRPKHFIYIILFIFILSLSRPLGLLYIPAALLYFYLIALRHTSMAGRLAFLGAMFLAFYYVLNRAMGSGGEYDFMLPFREEHIICGTPTLLQPLDFPVAGNGNSVYALLYYIFHHPGQFLRLAFLKTISFWGVYRSYFSRAHNTILLLYYYPIILMAILSLRSWQRQYPRRLVYLLALILVTWGTVVLTCDDWNNRIFLSISPYLIILAAGIFPSQKRRLEIPVAKEG